MALKFITAEEAASFVHHDDNVGFSGFTPAGCPKVVPGAIAKKAIAEHEKGNPFQIGMFTGASTGDKLDGELARANAIKFRTPYQSNKDLRALLNSHGAQYYDMHLSELAQSLRYGFLGKIDVAIVEAADVTEDGEIVPTSGVGILPTICRMADRIIIELNCRHPKEIRGMHDIYEPADPPYRREIPIYTPSDRIGSDCVKVDPAKIVGVVKTDEPNEGGKFSPLDDVTMAIGQNVANFLVGEIKAGRLPKEFVPLQSGVGNVANAVLGCMGENKDIPAFNVYTEVIQDAVIALMKEGRVKFASGCSLSVSNEVIRSRSNILAENIAKWGNPNSIVTNNDPEEIGRLTHLFDVIVTDVPCSGEGMFRKDTDSTGEWSVDNVRLCASRGRRIIHDIWNALKPGGILIYSTCTYNTEEDEENIHYIIEELGAEALPIPTQEEWQITGALRFEHPVYRFFPHKTRGEGFFLAALRKAEGEIEEIRVKSKGKKERGKAAPSIPQEARLFLSDETSFSLEWNDSFLRAYPKAHSDLFSLINAKPLRVLSAGICLGEAKGKDFIPSQELALSTALTPNAFPSVELEWEDAIKFLKKEALVLPSGTDKGYVLVRYQGLPLGFVKNLGNRANNLYPQEWRIRTGYIPEEIKLFLGR